MNRSQPLRHLTSTTRLATLSVGIAMALASTVQAAPPLAGTGTIKGRLVYAAGPVPEPKVAVPAGSPNVKDEICKVNDIYDKSLVVDPKSMGVGNAFAYLVKPNGDYAATEQALLEKQPEVVIDQIKCEFLPYATVVHKDQKLIFKSSDPVGHNVHFSAFANGAMNQMLPPNGKMVYPIKKEERRPTEVVCDIHPWMKSYFFIVDNPFTVVTEPDGSFEISGVPAGSQQLVVWQSTKGYVTDGGNKGMKVVVKAGETSDVGEVKLTK